MRRLLILVATLVVAAGVSGAAAAGTAFFQTPSKNIGCVYASADSGDPAYLRCDIATGLVPRPAKPAGCDLDWGIGLSLTPTGKARVVCAGDTARDPRAPVLQYGSTWRRGAFTCVSRTSGLRCTNGAHGFVMSRGRTTTF